MNSETLQRIERIEARAAELRMQIAELEQALENVYEEDEQYAGYLEAYRSYYNDEPLSIRRYYELSAEFDAINHQFDVGNCEELWAKYHERIGYLERVLAA